MLAPPQDYAVPVSDSKIARSVSSYVVREMNPPSATKQSARPASAHLPVTYEAVEDEEDSPSHELAFSLPSVGVPKTPTVLPDDMFADFFSSLPSGMIKVESRDDRSSLSKNHKFGFSNFFAIKRRRSACWAAVFLTPALQKV